MWCIFATKHFYHPLHAIWTYHYPCDRRSKPMLKSLCLLWPESRIIEQIGDRLSLSLKCMQCLSCGEVHFSVHLYTWPPHQSIVKRRIAGNPSVYTQCMVKKLYLCPSRFNYLLQNLRLQIGLIQSLIWIIPFWSVGGQSLSNHDHNLCVSSIPISHGQPFCFPILCHAVNLSVSNWLTTCKFVKHQKKPSNLPYK